MRPALLAAFAAACISCHGSPDPETFAGARNQMVEEQIAARGVTDAHVLQVMRDVPRHEFVPARFRDLAYADRPLPIGHGQTISQPFIVAFMTEQLVLKPTDRVLEIGTGSGYQAAILSRLAREVFTIEIVPELASGATELLQRLGFGNVQVKSGDGYQGWSEHAPFDAVVVTCAPDHVPLPLVEQLKEGGRMVIPVGEAGDQSLYLFEKRAGKLERRAVIPVQFVPMTGTAQKVRR